jgi:hypothetical protein
MKPRIVMDKGVYVCGRRGFIYGLYTVWFFEHPLGHGYSPKAAYDDWAAQL